MAIGRDDQGTSRNQFNENLRQHLIAGDFPKAQVEISREFYRHLTVTTCQGISVGIDNFPQLAEVGISHATDGAFDDSRLDRTPRLEYVTGFANRRLRHIGTPIGPEFNDLGMGKVYQDAADLRAGDAVYLAKRFFAQFRTGLEPSFDDRLVDLVIDLTFGSIAIPGTLRRHGSHIHRLSTLLFVPGLRRGVKISAEYTGGLSTITIKLWTIRNFPSIVEFAESK